MQSSCAEFWWQACLWCQLPLHIWRWLLRLTMIILWGMIETNPDQHWCFRYGFGFWLTRDLCFQLMCFQFSCGTKSTNANYAKETTYVSFAQLLCYVFCKQKHGLTHTVLFSEPTSAKKCASVQNTSSVCFLKHKHSRHKNLHSRLSRMVSHMRANTKHLKTVPHSQAKCH